MATMEHGHSNAKCCPACGYMPDGMDRVVWEDVCPDPICEACALSLVSTAVSSHLEAEEIDQKHPIARLANAAGRTVSEVQAAIITRHLRAIRGAGFDVLGLTEVLREISEGRPHDKTADVDLEQLIPAGAVILKIP